MLLDFKYPRVGRLLLRVDRLFPGLAPFLRLLLGNLELRVLRGQIRDGPLQFLDCLFLVGLPFTPIG